MIATYAGRARAFARNTAGATAIEYSLIAAGIALVIIGAIVSLGTSVSSTFNSIANGVN